MIDKSKEEIKERKGKIMKKIMKISQNLAINMLNPTKSSRNKQKARKFMKYARYILRIFQMSQGSGNFRVTLLRITRSKGSVNLPQGSVNLVVLCKVYQGLS